MLTETRLWVSYCRHYDDRNLVAVLLVNRTPEDLLNGLPGVLKGEKALTDGMAKHRSGQVSKKEKSQRFLYRLFSFAMVAKRTYCALKSKDYHSLDYLST